MGDSGRFSRVWRDNDASSPSLLRQRAVALGWSVEQVIVIDSDLGQSGASAVDRAGFQRLVTEVAWGTPES
jgi:hypothetical protein